jgi:hypothetical protein
VNREFLLFLFFLLLSGIFWLSMTLNESYDIEVRVPVQVTNVPNSIVMTSEETDTIKLNIHDKGLALLGLLVENQLKLFINFNNYNHQSGKLVITSSELSKLINQQLELSTKVNSIKPEKLEFYYNYGSYKKVPVRWSGRVLPEELYFISHTVYHPDSIAIFAPKDKLDSINAVYTEPLNYVNFRDTLAVTCKLQKTVGVKTVPDKVNIKFYTDVLTEESIDGIPIKAINMPAGKVLRTFPPKVKVRFVTGVSQFRTLRPEDFTVIADYEEISQKPSDKCNIYLKVIPHGISRAVLDTKEVDYLIEEE